MAGYVTQKVLFCMHVILKIWFLQNGPINVTLFTIEEREWETCRHNIDDQVLERNKIDCPSCGKEPFVKSSDAIVKLRRLSSAGKVRNPENERT
jgi:hypothetical protein